MKIIKAVFFDFDGVLIDSLPVMRKAWEEVKKTHYLNSEFEEFAQYIGIPFNIILEKLKINSEKHNLIQKTYSKEASKNIKLIKLNPYAEYILSWLRRKDIKIAIVTSKDFARTKELTEYLNIKTDLIVTPEKTLRGKPHPEPLFFAAKNLSIPIKESLFIGDMLSDMKAANNAKCRYLHYLCGYQQLDLNCNAYGGSINSLLEIKEYIESI